ncbi:MAG TPA: tetratricopeptide repeat protein [Xanthomonadaceae bacterium]|nr:tetratricopeptide repeat protein [Xanthomonadaceae bacterium]
MNVQATLAELHALFRAGRWQAVVDAAGAALRRHGEHAEFLHLRGVALHQLERSEEGRDSLDHALRLAPGHTALNVNRCALLLALGRFAETEQIARAVLAQRPDHAGCRLNLGLALEGQGEPAKAAEVLRSLLDTDPDATVVRRALARCRLAQGHPENVLELADAAACERDTLLAEIRARACARLGRWSEALDYWSSRCAQDRTDTGALVQLAHCLGEAGRSGEAIAPLREALKHAPDDAVARNLLDNALLMQGDIAEALELHQCNWEQAVDRADLHSNRLIALQHDPELTPERLLRVHQQWSERHLPVIATAPPRRRRAGVPLRVGFVSPRFHEGPVATFFLDVLPALAAGGIEPVLYQNSTHQDAATRAFAEAAFLWRDSSGWSDRRFCEQVGADRIDVLVELAGHAPGNRLKALAQRPAPVQVCWLDYFSTTGHPAVDVLLTDAYLSPSGSEAHYSETLVRLPRGRLCYGAPMEAPGPGPVSERGGVFGAFNRLSKLNDRVAGLWARILHALPDWTLRVRAAAAADPVHRARLLERFAAFGIDPGRLELEGFGSYRDTMESWRSIDIALDPFPFSGCATSCDALWMGVPVIALEGCTMVGRQTGSLLHHLGRDEWIAEDEDAYVELACTLARNVRQREACRETLRDEVTTRLADAPAFAHDLAEALRGL